jgi:CheY-like chemotaxis protein
MKRNFMVYTDPYTHEHLEAPCPSLCPNGPERILVMDDDDSLRRLIHMALTYAGYDVVCVREGAAAIAAYETAKVSGHPFGAVILDLHIKGGMGGQATLAHLRAYDPGVKAILCSAACHDPVMEHYDAYGFAARLSKPFNRLHLQQLLQHIIYN